MKKRRTIIGIDEVGRGSLAGPVYVAALAMPQGLDLRRKKLAKLKDSKKLNPKQRKEWADYLENHPEISYVVAGVSPGVVDKKNVTQAANLAATRAFVKLTTGNPRPAANARVYLDGGLFLDKSLVTGRKLSVRTLVRGDEKINAIKLASIVAKVKRDEYMIGLHDKYPKYGFDNHKGYGTKRHKKALKKHGPSPVHRLTFV